MLMKITTNSHLDHGLSQRLVNLISEKYADREKFFIDTFTIPEDCPSVPCSLHAEVPEHECFYRRRKGRKTWSRMTTRRLTYSDKVTVIGGMSNGECILFTAYGGPLAPREPGDADIADATEATKSFLFWRSHALCASAFELEA
jgi:hypothetical protein